MMTESIDIMGVHLIYLLAADQILTHVLFPVLLVGQPTARLPLNSEHQVKKQQHHIFKVISVAQARTDPRSSAPEAHALPSVFW